MFRFFAIVILINFTVVGLLAQVRERAGGTKANEGIGKTWKGPRTSLIASLLRKRSTTTGKPAAIRKTPSGVKPDTADARINLDVVKFRPAGESGVPASLAQAFGTGDEQIAQLTEGFRQIRDGIEAELAKEGKSNDLAAAMAVFVATNVAVYHQSELPSNEASEELYEKLRGNMNATPAFAQMSNSEKHQMSDWLVCMAGFVLTTYQDAKQNGNRDALATSRDLADYSMRLVLGVEVAKMNFAGSNLVVEGADASAQGTGMTDSKIVGAWSSSASNHTGTDLVTNPGYTKSRYQFKADGTYHFKHERWLGYMRSNEFWTTEETGTYSVVGDSLTLLPRSSKTTLRNRDGAVLKTTNEPLEKVTYSWLVHYFEGIDENNLILKTAKETRRDGLFTTNSSFPNSYLYSSRDNLEFRF